MPHADDGSQDVQEKKLALSFGVGIYGTFLHCLCMCVGNIQVEQQRFSC